jgi:hypothetical protein
VETILGLLGVDKDLIERQMSELFAQFKLMCEYSEESREMLLFLVENLTDKQKEELAARLKTIQGKYKNG